MSENVYIIGVGMIKFGKYLEKGIKVLSGEVLDEVFQDSGLSAKDIEAAWFSNTGWGMYTFQHSIRGQVVMRSMGTAGNTRPVRPVVAVLPAAAAPLQQFAARPPCCHHSRE